MIVDASVAVKWLVREDDSAEALVLLDAVDLVAPTLIHAEVANAIWKKRRRGQFADDDALASLPDRLATILQTIDETPMMTRALDLAVVLDHPVYDCIYLAVAEALDCEMVTADQRFLRVVAGRAEGHRVRSLEAAA